ncbi:DsbA family protein [Acuticoccus sp. M5D2P5]|uniref:DsbA family protein n=1 Tax=Acuticoccus kalidii TaxID=2910977 RepID=UPI001F384500|nr:DsbA family protein [Acuticoccus kalidii]MCF3932942.1 DsbA family protein [Acuticoccus kalidii]
MTDLNRRTILVGIGATAGLGVGIGAARAQSPLSQEAVFLDPGVPVLGNPAGDVSLVEYFDYQCPYCKAAHPDVAEVVADDGRVRHVMKDWPIFGEPSLYAARITLGAGADYRIAMAALMATEGRLTTTEVDAALRGAGLDPAALWAAYRKDAQAIDATLARTGRQAEAFGFMGTPAYVAGTTIFAGVAEPSALRAALRKARGG